MTGNFLNGLLGLTQANSGAAKAAATKSRAQSSEKFQQAFEQARPEVAAPRPASRKAIPSTSASDRPQKPATEPHKRPDGRAHEPRSRVADNDKKEVAKVEPTSKAPATEAAANNRADVNEKRDAGELEQGEVTDPQLAGPSLTTDATGALVAGLLNSNDLNDQDEAPAEEIDPSLVAEAGLLLLTPTPAVDTPLISGGISGIKPATGASPLGMPLTAGLQSANVASAPGQSSTVMNADDITGNILGGLKLDADSADSPVDGEATGDSEMADMGDNPDFLLLNSKAALNKLTESAVAADTLDKPVADAAKPTVSAALESLTRLSEAQSPAARAFVVQTGVPTTVGSPQWSQAVGDKVLWLAAQNVSSAEIRLDPPELGSLQVKVSVNQDQTSISFVSPHPAVREVLDQQLHRLREMFSDQGLNLVNVDVSDKSFAQQQRDQNNSSNNHGANELADEDLTPVAVTHVMSPRLVDHYA